MAITAALYHNPGDRVSVLALRDWLQEHGGDGSPLLVPVVWVVEESDDEEGKWMRGIYGSREMALQAVDGMISDTNLRHIYRKVRDNEASVEWEAGTRTLVMYAYKVVTTLEQS